MDFKETLLTKMNGYITEKMQEQKLKLLLDMPLTVVNAEVIDINLFVIEDDVYGANDVHVFEQTLKMTFENGKTLTQNYRNLDSESIVMDGFITPNESEIEYIVSNGGHRYPQLAYVEYRHHNREEKIGLQLLGALDFAYFFNDEIKDEWFYHFTEEETKKLSDIALPYMPFVKSLIYHGGSTVQMIFENGMQLPIEEQLFRSQLTFVRQQEEIEKVLPII